MNVFIFFRNFNHAVKFSFDKVQDVDVLSNVEEGRESGVVELIGETTAFRCFCVEDRDCGPEASVKSWKNAHDPHQDFRDQRDTRRAWLGIIGIDQKCLIAVLDDFDQHSKLMNAENTLRGVWVDMSVACRFEEFFEDSREKTAVERLQNRISVHAEGRKI